MVKNGAIDIGNTQVKWGVFDPTGLKEQGGFRNPAEAATILNKAENWIVSSTRKNEPLPEGLSHLMIFDADTPVPVINKYKTPQTLGRDRLAAVCGAAAQFPRKNCLVIDAGTCITYDFVNASGEYTGGSISP